MHVCHGTGMWRSKGNLGESVLSFYPAGSRDHTQFVRFGKCLRAEPFRRPGQVF